MSKCSRPTIWQCNLCGKTDANEVRAITDTGAELCGNCLIANKQGQNLDISRLARIEEVVDLRCRHLTSRSLMQTAARRAWNTWRGMTLVVCIVILPLAAMIERGLSASLRGGTLISCGIAAFCLVISLLYFLFLLLASFMARETPPSAVSIEITERVIRHYQFGLLRCQVEHRVDQCEWHCGIPEWNWHVANCSDVECICINYERQQIVCGLTQSTRACWQRVLTAIGCRRIVGVEEERTVFWRAVCVATLVKLAMFVTVGVVAALCVNLRVEVLKYGDVTSMFASTLGCLAAFGWSRLRGRQLFDGERGHPSNDGGSAVR